MKKFIIPVINLVCLVMSAVIFGLGANSAVYIIGSSTGAGNWYQLVWTIPETLSVIAVLGFFLFIAAVALCLFAMIPFKFRKFVEVCVAGLFIAAGVMFLLTPGAIYGANVDYKTASLITMVVLAFVSGGLTCFGALLDFLPEKK